MAQFQDELGGCDIQDTLSESFYKEIIRKNRLRTWGLKTMISDLEHGSEEWAAVLLQVFALHKLHKQFQSTSPPDALPLLFGHQRKGTGRARRKSLMGERQQAIKGTQKQSRALCLSFVHQTAFAHPAFFLLCLHFLP
eukprot:3282113-Prymnesium_polylepis.1